MSSPRLAIITVTRPKIVTDPEPTVNRGKSKLRVRPTTRISAYLARNYGVNMRIRNSEFYEYSQGIPPAYRRTDYRPTKNIVGVLCS